MLTLKNGNQLDKVDEAFEAVAENENCNNHQQHRCDHLGEGFILNIVANLIENLLVNMIVNLMDSITMNLVVYLILNLVVNRIVNMVIVKKRSNWWSTCC